MKQTACTAWVPDEQYPKTKNRRCGRVDMCTRVVTKSSSGKVLQEHDVCSSCRRRMKLPDKDVTFGGGPVFINRAMRREMLRKAKGT